MKITRRDMLKASAAILASRSLIASGAIKLQEALEGQGNVPVIWLQGNGCNGCSVSLLNSIYYMTVDNLLLNTIDLKFHPTVMAAAGDLAAGAAESAHQAGGYVLVVEGAIPVGESGDYCEIWEGMPMQNAVTTYAPNAAWILAVGSCAAYGGVTAGNPNPTTALGVEGLLGSDARIINIPGCPSHPDWVVGTIAYLLANGEAPALDAKRRPLDYFGMRIHSYCENRREYCNVRSDAAQLGQAGCLEPLGCRGKQTYADCFMRKWNSGQANTYGVNWCVASRSPCHGCVEPNFPDGMSPFFT